MKKIKVLVVDDSIFMRTTLKKIISSNDVEVIYTARNGKEGLEKTIELKPDIVTMDIEMPVMNGLDSLKEIMKHSPTPVIMISTLTKEGADSTITALNLGAYDFVTKKDGISNMELLKDEIHDKILNIYHSTHNNVSFKSKEENLKANNRLSLSIAQRLAEKSRSKKIVDKSTIKKRPKKDEIKAIAIGISTGGPAALEKIIKELRSDLPVPILVAQHMPPFFTKTLSERLNKLTKLTVKEAENNEYLHNGYIYLAEGGKHMQVKHNKIKVFEDDSFAYSPCVDLLMDSMSKSFPSSCVGIIMTGMGNDGEKGFAELHKNNCYIMSQDIDTCVVSGMVKSVIKQNIVDEIHPITDMAQVINSLFD